MRAVVSLGLFVLCEASGNGESRKGTWSRGYWAAVRICDRVVLDFCTPSGLFLLGHGSLDSIQLRKDHTWGRKRQH
jgi:hypothetical protein